MSQYLLFETHASEAYSLCHILTPEESHGKLHWVLEHVTVRYKSTGALVSVLWYKNDQNSSYHICPETYKPTHSCLFCHCDRHKYDHVPLMHKKLNK